MHACELSGRISLDKEAYIYTISLLSRPAYRIMATGGVPLPDAGSGDRLPARGAIRAEGDGDQEPAANEAADDRLQPPPSPPLSLHDAGGELSSHPAAEYLQQMIDGFIYLCFVNIKSLISVYQ